MPCETQYSGEIANKTNRVRMYYSLLCLLSPFSRGAGVESRALSCRRLGAVFPGGGEGAEGGVAAAPEAEVDVAAAAAGPVAFPQLLGRHDAPLCPRRRRRPQRLASRATLSTATVTARFFSQGIHDRTTTRPPRGKCKCKTVGGPLLACAFTALGIHASMCAREESCFWWNSALPASIRHTARGIAVAPVHSGASADCRGREEMLPEWSRVNRWTS